MTAGPNLSAIRRTVFQDREIAITRANAQATARRFHDYPRALRSVSIMGLECRRQRLPDDNFFSLEKRVTPGIWAGQRPDEVVNCHAGLVPMNLAVFGATFRPVRGLTGILGNSWCGVIHKLWQKLRDALTSQHADLLVKRRCVILQPDGEWLLPDNVAAVGAFVQVEKSQPASGQSLDQRPDEGMASAIPR